MSNPNLTVSTATAETLARILEAAEKHAKGVGHPHLPRQHWAVIAGLAADEQQRRAGGGA